MKEILMLKKDHYQVVLLRLNEDLTIFTSNFDDQSQFLKTNFFPDYLHMIKRHTFCFSYLSSIKRYTFCVSIIISSLFQQVLSRNFMKKYTTYDVWCTWGRVNVHEKHLQIKTDHRSPVEWWSVLKICTDSQHYYQVQREDNVRLIRLIHVQAVSLALRVPTTHHALPL